MFKRYDLKAVKGLFPEACLTHLSAPGSAGAAKSTIQTSFRAFGKATINLESVTQTVHTAFAFQLRDCHLSSANWDSGDIVPSCRETKTQSPAKLAFPKEANCEPGFIHT